MHVVYVCTLLNLYLYLSIVFLPAIVYSLYNSYIPYSRPLCYVEVVSVLKLLEAPVPLVCVAFVPAGRPPLTGFVPVVARIA